MTSEEWLKNFFQIVDHNRLEQGKKIYRDDRLIWLKKHQNGFSAAIKGLGGNQDELNAHFVTDEDGMPDLEQLSIKCSCKDWVEFCKHAICALISYCEEYSDKKHIVFHEKRTEVEGLLNRGMEQLTDLGPLPVLGKERSFDQMQHIVQKKLREQSW